VTAHSASSSWPRDFHFHEDQKLPAPRDQVDFSDRRFPAPRQDAKTFQHEQGCRAAFA
jgi:hypothetical protein